MREELLTPRVLNIPVALAKKYSKGKVDLYEDIVSEGNVALVEALQTFDDTKGTTFSTYAFRAVRWATTHLLRQRVSVKKCVFQTTMTSLDSTLDKNGVPLLATLEKKERAGLDFDPEVVKRLFLRTNPIHRAVLKLLHEGLTYRQVAARIGASKQTVYNMQKSITTKLVEKYRVMQWCTSRKGVHNRVMPIWDSKARDNARRSRNRVVLAKRICGELSTCASAKYVVNDTAREVMGPAETLGAILKVLGCFPQEAEGRTGRGSRTFLIPALERSGWRKASGLEVRALIKEGFRLRPEQFNTRTARKGKQ